MKTTEFEEWILRSSRREEYFEVLNSICGILEELNINEMQLVKIRTDFQMLEQIWLTVVEKNIIEFYLQNYFRHWLYHIQNDLIIFLVHLKMKNTGNFDQGFPVASRIPDDSKGMLFSQLRWASLVSSTYYFFRVENYHVILK